MAAVELLLADQYVREPYQCAAVAQESHKLPVTWQAEVGNDAQPPIIGQVLLELGQPLWLSVRGLRSPQHPYSEDACAHISIGSEILKRVRCDTIQNFESKLRSLVTKTVTVVRFFRNPSFLNHALEAR